ncbi:MAG: ribonuclease J [Alphaproteobacteria bacterium]|jgi:ribonuclease J|nr:ribonuclease J [Alphaproteobacteria bacterium]MBU2042718.1 ribonuclease J [Alphaproteobacteria bacterium]MBU2126159.1 ribonuclease J [Alphaproteobacteria bacterium]MBU2208879.1 ribonuclease J [Alphaproteobacteria bacterium]MBU2290390.1 ribonuclease J [Alphaproteobacteria bacterium]
MKKNSNDELVFVPLGGSGEIGMNLNCYGYGPESNRQWLIVDVGVTFGDLSTPGVDVIVPDPAFLDGENIRGIVLTHAHEDHIGALGWLWHRIKAPIYATPFTAFLIREKLREAGILNEVKIIEVPLSGTIDLGPFQVTMITMTHSIAEPNSLAIKTPLGTVFHTGDWKLDPSPVIGQPTDIAAITKLGDEGLLAMVCDSTNVFVEGQAGSELDAQAGLIELIGSLKTGRIAVGCFASNVARMVSVIKAAQLAGRRVALAGRSMHRITAAARHVGLFNDSQRILTEEEARVWPADEILYLCTGSQGEDRAALSRAAQGTHPFIKLGLGDHCIFSSRVIPGNELSIAALQDKLADRGVRLYTEKDHPHVHVSGHPCRDEMKQMYAWARPRIAVPTHGMRRHLAEHANMARDLGVAETVTPRNGDMVRLAPGLAAIIDEVPSGRLYVDGGRLVTEQGEALHERRHASTNGVLIVSFAMDKRGKIVSDIDVRAIGLPGDDASPLGDALDNLAERAEQAVMKLKGPALEDEMVIEQAVSRALKKASQQIWDRRPIVETIILRM